MGKPKQINQIFMACQKKPLTLNWSDRLPKSSPRDTFITGIPCWGELPETAGQKGGHEVTSYKLGPGITSFNYLFWAIYKVFCWLLIYNWWFLGPPCITTRSKTNMTIDDLSPMNSGDFASQLFFASGTVEHSTISTSLSTAYWHGQLFAEVTMKIARVWGQAWDTFAHVPLFQLGSRNVPLIGSDDIHV